MINVRCFRKKPRLFDGRGFCAASVSVLDQIQDLKACSVVGCKVRFADH